jgi:hypothetical protein
MSEQLFNFNAWRTRMGYSLQAAADALGISRSTAQVYDAAKRKGQEIPLTVRLACENLARQYETPVPAPTKYIDLFKVQPTGEAGNLPPPILINPAQIVSVERRGGSASTVRMSNGDKLLLEDLVDNLARMLQGLPIR